jgi:outer membrane immunogenic protein
LPYCGRTRKRRTGGLAVGEVKFATTPTLTAQLFDGNTPIGAPITVTATTVSDSPTRGGLTAGARLEKKFSPNWSARLEYLYLDFGTKTYFSGTASAVDVSFQDHIFRAGINYAFSPAALVAKY